MNQLSKQNEQIKNIINRKSKVKPSGLTIYYADDKIDKSSTTPFLPLNLIPKSEQKGKDFP
jgi:hypothetical protein